MKKILIPTDFSDNAWNAIFTALKIFSKVECQFYLLNAYEPSLFNVLGDKSQQRLGVIYESLSKNAQLELDKIMDYLKEHHSNSEHHFETVPVSESLVYAIKEIQLQRDIDLIVMGTQGATGAKEVFLGSNTTKVIKAVRNCPILAVPEQYNFQTLKELVFPTDFTHFFEKSELLPMLELAKLWNARINVLHAAQGFSPNEEQKTNRAILEEYLKGFESNFHEVVLQADVEDAITGFAKDIEADIIVLVHYQHSFFEKLTREPVVKKVGFRTEIPLLVLPG